MLFTFEIDIGWNPTSSLNLLSQVLGFVDVFDVLKIYVKEKRNDAQF